MYNTIQKQLEVLNTKVGFFGRTKIEDHLEALDQIAELGTVYDVQHIIRYVFSDNELISQKTAMVIRNILTQRRMSTTWLNLYSHFSHYNDDSLSKKVLKKFEHFLPEEAAHLYGIVSLNRNGYVREEALGYLQNLSTSEVLPYVLLRLNDWVPQVQAKARKVLEEILPSIPIADLIKYHRLIEWLEKTKRVKLKDVQNKIFTQIHHSHNREDLWEVLEKRPFKERFFCWKVVLAKEITNDDCLIDKAITDPAPEIRQWAAHHLPKSEHFKDRLSILLVDRAVRVRYAALKTIPFNDFDKYRQLFEEAIFDDSKPIRDYARFMLRAHGDEGHVGKYRQRLSEIRNNANPGAVAGLAETGVKEDIPQLKTFINHKKPNIRASVLTGLNRLEAENVDHLYILGIQDDNAKIRNTCTSILQSGYSHLRPELEHLLKKGNIKSKKSALKVLMHYGVLNSLQNILFTLTEPDEELQEVAWQYLISWHKQHALKLWFTFSDDTYNRTMKLLNKLRKTRIEPPYHAHNAWNDLPTIMKALAP